MWESLEGELTGKGRWMDTGMYIRSCVLEPRNLISTPNSSSHRSFPGSGFHLSVATCLSLLTRVCALELIFVVLRGLYEPKPDSVSPLSLNLQDFIAYSDYKHTSYHNIEVDPSPLTIPVPEYLHSQFCIPAQTTHYDYPCLTPGKYQHETEFT